MLTTTDPEADLEQTFIREFLYTRGCDVDDLAQMSDTERTAILTDASKYAAMKLAEVESRARFVHEIHGA